MTSPISVFDSILGVASPIEDHSCFVCSSRPRLFQAAIAEGGCPT